jgi:hypothetical protein
MDVLGHKDAGGYSEALLFSGLFEDLLDYIFCFVGVEQGLTLVTTEGDEVELFGLLEAFEAGGHGGTSSLHPTLRRSAKDGAPELFGGWLRVELCDTDFWVGGECKGGAPGTQGLGWILCIEPPVHPPPKRCPFSFLVLERGRI